MTSQKIINAPCNGRGAKSHEWTFCDPITAPRVGRPNQWPVQYKGRQGLSLIREESENRVFHFPLSKKPRMDFLRPY